VIVWCVLMGNIMILTRPYIKAVAVILLILFVAYTAFAFQATTGWPYSAAGMLIFIAASVPIFLKVKKHRLLLLIICAVVICASVLALHRLGMNHIVIANDTDYTIKDVTVVALGYGSAFTTGPIAPRHRVAFRFVGLTFSGTTQLIYGFEDGSGHIGVTKCDNYKDRMTIHIQEDGTFAVENK